jgi:hypothetical protein
MRRTATLLIGLTLMTSFAATAMAAYKYPPGPPYRSCPDTLTVFDIQRADTTIVPCSPARLDTVWGIKGTITGFDRRASAYAVYMQDGTGAAAYNGIDVFTGATNYAGAPYNLVIGDNIVAYGTTQEFPVANGETELEGPDANQGTNDIIIRKTGSTTPLAPYIVTTTQLNWVPSSPGNEGEKYEGTFVRIRGPLRVARVTPAGGAGLFNNNWLLVRTTNTADSVMIDGFTLPTAAIANPALGAIVDSVQGIVNQRDGQGGINSYRIQIRDGNDQFLAVPPTASDAFPVEDNKVRVLFDRNVDVATAQNPGNYSLGSAIDGSTVDAAVVVGGSGSTVELTITSVRNDGDAETIAVSGVGAATCPTCVISPAQTLNFIQGVLTVKDVQTPAAASLPLYDDRSRFAGAGTAFGTRFSVRGVATAQFGSLFYMQDEGGGLRSGVSVFGPISTLVPNHKYLIAGRVQEFDFETEVVNTVYIADEGTTGAIQPVLGNIHVIADTTTDQSGSVANPEGNNLTGEDYEGMLVQVHGHITENRTVGQSFFLTGFAEVGNDTILISNLNGALNAYDPPDSMTRMRIVGVLHYANGRFRVCPRSAADISSDVAGVGDFATALEFAVGPNPGRTARVTFALPTARIVDIGVFDLAGRRVATVAKGQFTAGRHTREWNGLDASGKRVSSGMYFYRASLGSDVRTTRAVLID